MVGGGKEGTLDAEVSLSKPITSGTKRGRGGRG